MNGQLVYQANLPAGTIQAGTFSVSASGGGGVGPFQAAPPTGSGIQLTSQFPPGSEISTSKPLTINWTGGRPGSVVTARVVEHQFLGDYYLEAQAPASDGSITFNPLGSPPLLPIQLSENVGNQ